MPHNKEIVTKIQNKIRHVINVHGHIVMKIRGEEGIPSHAYTIGLYDRLGHELIIFGMSLDAAEQLLNYLAYHHFKDHDPLEPGEEIDDLLTVPVRIVECDPFKAEKYVFHASLYNMQPVQFYQIVLPDMSGKFYDQPGYDIGQMEKIQPLLCSTH